MDKLKKLEVENSNFYSLVLTVCSVKKKQNLFFNLVLCEILSYCWLIVSNKQDELTYAQLLTASTPSDFGAIQA